MKNYIVLFGLGAFAYGLLEVLWRGNSHWTMMIAGGIVFVIFSLIAEKFKGLPLLYKCILGSLTVTVIELVFGVIFNLVLGFNVWDYSHIPINLFGQICLLFSVLWGLLSIVAIPLSYKALSILKRSEEGL
ncbi:MAG: hypothetical protein J6Q74_02960 [Clostridia bacterium]|nr:hypothetical protein [Clostridia bacterium]